MTLKNSFRKLGMGFAAVAVLAFTMGRWSAPGGRDRTSPPPSAAALPASAGRAQMYYCSMHPQIRSPNSDDKCPICFMDLIPLPEDEIAGDAGSARPALPLSPETAALLDIRTWPVERRALELPIHLFGKVAFDESRFTDVAVRTEAYLESAFVQAAGESVRAGEVLAELYAPAVTTAFRELLETKAGDTNRRQTIHERLFRLGVTAEETDRVLREGVAPRTFRLTSPASGVLESAPPRAGERLPEGARLARIADLRRVWIQLEAYERDLPWLRVGQRAEIFPAGQADASFSGEIAFIEPTLNEVKRTARVRIEADNPELRLRPGAYVFARIRASYPPDAPASARDLPMVIPASAPLLMGRRALVYVRTSDSEIPAFEGREVRLGPRAGEWYAVLDGLTEGERVVVSGQFKIDSELQIRGRPSLMSPASGGAAAPSHHAHGGE